MIGRSCGRRSSGVAHASACWCEFQHAPPKPWAEAHGRTLKRAPLMISNNLRNREVHRVRLWFWRLYETSKPCSSVEREQAPVAMGGQDGGVDQARRDSLGGWVRRRTRPVVCRNGRERHAHQAESEVVAGMLLCPLRCRRCRARRGSHVHLLALAG